MITIVFFGNTKFSLIGAKIIHEHLGLSHIVTLPDRPDKRGRITPNPMKLFAKENDIPLLTVDKLDKESIDSITALHPDFFVVEDYGLILPKTLLSVPTYASLNIHHSLLPKYRGSSPAPFAILNGDTVTGVTVIEMAEKVDTGAIFAQTEYHMRPDETTESLLTELNKLGGEIIIPVIKNFKQMKPRPQDESRATYTKQFTREDGYIDLSAFETLKPLEISNLKLEIARKIRAYYPWPAVWTLLRLSAMEGQVKEKMVKFLPENKLQVEGKNIMNIKDFLNGYPEMKDTINKLFNK